jgi:hypothetical protein
VDEDLLLRVQGQAAPRPRALWKGTVSKDSRHSLCSVFEFLHLLKHIGRQVLWIQSVICTDPDLDPDPSIIKRKK